MTNPFREHVRQLGFDPDEVTAKGPITAWTQTTAEGDQKVNVRADLDVPPPRNFAMEDLIARAASQPDLWVPDEPQGDHTVVVNLADWQAGLGEGGGSPALIGRVDDMITSVADYLARKHREGFEVDDMFVAGLGDACERCTGHYPHQQFAVDLSEREQVTLVYGLTDKALRTWARMVSRITTGAVASNHGQNRSGGKMVTEPADDLDLTIWDMLETHYRDVPALDHINFYSSPDPMVMTVGIRGHVACWIHGHQARRGGGMAVNKTWQWWSDQSQNNRPAGEACILTVGHYHHHYKLQQSGKTLLGCPSLDGGSKYFTDSRGVWSDPGTLVYLIGPDGVTQEEVL